MPVLYSSLLFKTNISQKQQRAPWSSVEPFINILGSFVFPLVPFCPHEAVLTPGEEDGVELQAASILQATGQLTEEAAVQVEGDSQGLPTALHLVTHWSVCNTHTAS